jgi:hypothetical protein
VSEELTLAFNVDAVRKLLLGAALPVIPERMVERAFKATDRALDATDRHGNPNYDAQLRGSDQVYSLVGAYAPKATGQAAVGVRVEIDPATGVISVIAGSSTNPSG